MIPKCSFCDEDAIGYAFIWPGKAMKLFFALRTVRFCEEHEREARRRIEDEKNDLVKPFKGVWSTDLAVEGSKIDTTGRTSLKW